MSSRPSNMAICRGAVLCLVRSWTQHFQVTPPLATRVDGAERQPRAVRSADSAVAAYARASRASSTEIPDVEGSSPQLISILELSNIRPEFSAIKRITSP